MTTLGFEASRPDNIAAKLTPAGAGAIAVVRIAGPRVADFLRRHFSARPAIGRCVHGALADETRALDDPVVVLLPGGGADINLHGSPYIVRATLELLEREGFTIEKEMAPEGQSAVERLMNGSIPPARTELALRALLAQPSAWEKFAARSGFDPWQADPPPAPPEAPGELQEIIADQTLLRLLHPPTVAIVGAANVGKSTLANHLFGQERSITADVPGTTRDWVGEIANIEGQPILLLDTPGQRESADAIEQAAIARSRPPIAAADLVTLVLDVTRPLSPEQEPLLAAHPKALVVANKVDGPWAWDPHALAKVQTTATSGDGVASLRQAILSRLNIQNIQIDRPRWWTPAMRAKLEEVLCNARSAATTFDRR